MCHGKFVQFGLSKYRGACHFCSKADCLGQTPLYGRFQDELVLHLLGPRLQDARAIIHSAVLVLKWATAKTRRPKRRVCCIPVEEASHSLNSESNQSETSSSSPSGIDSSPESFGGSTSFAPGGCNGCASPLGQCTPPPPLYKPRPCPSDSRRRDRTNCVPNLITYGM